MTVKEIKEILNAEVISGDEKELLSEIKMGCGCDLMSDVLSFIKSNTLLLTGLTNRQVIYTAEIAEIKVICFVRGKKPDKEVIDLAKQKNIILLRTELPMFESCGKLYKAGLIGCSEGE
jgi:predicted transcriptional regulator